MKLQLHTQQLRDGKRDEITATLSPEFLEIQEKDITFKTPIHIQGEAYATEDHLILQLSARTEVNMPCTICNEMVFVPLEAKNIYHTIPFDELKSLIFDFTDLVREEIVLLIPQFIECRQGKCPERSDISKFMKKKIAAPHNHFPFADL